MDNSLFLVDNKNNDDESKEKDLNKKEDNSKKDTKKKDSDGKEEEKEKNNNIVLVEINSLKLINSENKKVIVTFDNKDNNILAATFEKNILTKLNVLRIKHFIGRVIYMVENNKIINIKRDNFIKN